MGPASDSPAPRKMEPSLYTPTPRAWRVGIGVVVVVLATVAYWMQRPLGSRGQAMLGIVCFLGVAALFSSNLRAVNWRTFLWGIGLQLGLVLFIDKFVIFGYNPGREFFRVVGNGATSLMGFTRAGTDLVFGNLGVPGSSAYFAFGVLPTIIFIASFFSVLYYFGVLQLIVRILARVMMYLLGTSGAETLSVSANIFMGQTEAPLIIKPYIPGMTQSELLTMMVGGMAHISGGLMAVYMGMGGQPEAILATSVMAAPGSLYLSKILLPELGEPETRGHVKASIEQPHINVIDAAASGASDGLRLALNVAAMLIAFMAFIALFNALLSPMKLSLEQIFSWIFSPVAVLMGVDGDQNIKAVAELLGKKLVLNEFVAYTDLNAMLGRSALQQGSPAAVGGGASAVLLQSLVHQTSIQAGSRANILATYALTGFANFASIGIQIGGIGAIAPTRRHDLARLGPRALLTGFLVTLINASIAGLLLSFPEP